MALFAFCQAESTPCVVDTSELTVMTPSLAHRNTKKLRLSNQLEVLLVSDPETPYGAAALSVGIGSSHDPEERAGLAHYTEHMLFLGNAKYPGEEEFSHFLDSHGGKRNACTLPDRTVYMFSIANEGFEQGLDHFAHMFISPNFTSSGLQRECKAIHQEYCKNLPIDDWRMLHVKKALCNQDHPFHGFSTGNMSTLHNVTHDEIKTWYETNYSANLMRLCIYSNKSLDELEGIIVPLFEKIENHNKVREESKQSLILEEKEKKCCFVTSVQGRCCLELSWELPKVFVQDQERHVAELISYILGHEGENSLFSTLQKEALAHKLCCGKQKVGVNEALFVLSIELTNEGVKQYEKVIAHCFDKITSLQKSGIENYIYDEVQKIEELKYAYQTRSDLFDYVMEHAMAMIDEPIESYPKKTLLASTFDKEACREFLMSLTPQKANYMLLAPNELTGVSTDKIEKWMEVAYTEKLLQPSLWKKLAKMEEKESKNALPSPNLFLPSELKVSTADFQCKASFDVIAQEHSEQGELYVARDHCFLTPKSSWHIHYKTPSVSPKIEKSGALMDLFALAFSEKINEKLYAAKVAHFDFSLASKEDGFTLSIHGFEEKMPLLMDMIGSKLTTITLSSQELAIYKERLLKEYECALLESPLKQAAEMTNSILYQNYQTMEQKSEQLLNITLAEANRFCKKIFKKGYLEASCYGSSESSNTTKMVWEKMIATLHFSPYPKEEQVKRKLARFSAMGYPTYLENHFPMPSGGLLVTLDFGDFSFEKRAVQEILSKALAEPFFSELRTRQQTAYLVTNWSQELERHLYNFFAIQSSSHDPRDLLARFELFLESFLANFEREHVPKERFARIKQALVKQLLYPQFDFAMMGSLFHTLAFEYKGDFAWLEKRAQAVEELSYEDFLASVYRTMKQSRQERVAVLVKGTFTQEAPFAYELAHSIHSIKERLEYK